MEGIQRIAAAILLLAAGCAGPPRDRGAPAAIEPRAARPDGGVAALVEQLGDEDYRTRRDAWHRLLERAATEPDRVLGALPADAADAEVRCSADQLRRRVPWQPYHRRAERCAGVDPDMKAAVEMLFDALYERRSFSTADDADPLTTGKALASQRARLIAGAGFLEHPDAAVRMDALAALQLLGEPSVAARVVDRLRDVGHTRWQQGFGADVLVCDVAAGVLGSLGGASIVPCIEPLLAEDDARVRRAAVEALGQIGHTSVEPLIEPRLADADGQVRAAAVRALSRFPAAAPRIAPMLDDDDPGVRRSAIYALGTTGRRAWATQLVPRLADEDDGVRRAAVSAIAQLGDRSVSEAVCGYLDHPQARVRESALLCLGALGDHGAEARIARQLDSPEKSVREAAATAIGWLSGNWWPDDDGDARVASARAWWADRDR